MLKLEGALIRERKFTLSEVRFEIDNWPKMEDALFHEPELISEKIEYKNCPNLSFVVLVWQVLKLGWIL